MLVVVGAGGCGWEEAGLVIAAPTPFPIQLLRFHLTFVTRLVFCYCCTFTCVGAEKVHSFRAFSITFGRIGTVFIYFPTTCRKRI